MSEKDLKNFEKNEIAGNTDKVNRKSSINYRDSIHKPGDNNAHMANDNEGEFKFVNEKVVNNKRLTLGKLLLFLVMCGIPYRWNYYGSCCVYGVRVYETIS